MTVPVHLINQSEDLKKCVAHLNSCKEFAIDLEFDKNFYRFGFNLCLVQIFDGLNCYLIDPHSRQLDIKLLFPALENNSIQKVCFSFDEDLRLLHSMGCFPKNLYDLDTASRLLNYPAMSLANLIQDILQIETDTSSQLSNWYKRPLTEKQMAYAADDVLHLLELKTVLNEKAEKGGLKEWIAEENESLNNLDYSDINHNEIIKEKDKTHYNEIEWHIYKKLLNWRNELAQKYNKPAFQVIDNNLIKSLVKNPEQRINWMRQKGIFRKLKTKKIATELSQLLAEALNEASAKKLSQDKPAKKPLNGDDYKEMQAQKRRVDQLKQTFFKPVKERIEELYGAEFANYVLSNRIITDFITGNNGEIKSYKIKLIEQIADELNLDKAPLRDCVRVNGE